MQPRSEREIRLVNWKNGTEPSLPEIVGNQSDERGFDQFDPSGHLPRSSNSGSIPSVHFPTSCCPQLAGHGVPLLAEHASVANIPFPPAIEWPWRQVRAGG